LSGTRIVLNNASDTNALFGLKEPIGLIKINVVKLASETCNLNEIIENDKFDM